MKQVKLLDCTLRDGRLRQRLGVRSRQYCYYFERLISAGVDILEVGFLDDRAPSTATARSCRQPSVPIRFSASWTREIR